MGPDCTWAPVPVDEDGAACLVRSVDLVASPQALQLVFHGPQGPWPPWNCRPVAAPVAGDGAWRLAPGGVAAGFLACMAAGECVGSSVVCGAALTATAAGLGRMNILCPPGFRGSSRHLAPALARDPPTGCWH